ncbi:MAG: pyridoxamine 5'-phosphate oxidase [Bacteroidia bacterium]|jgi:pyridoxamine 5'-phosphate oxidase|nr:pyridoxamine 5'-phosphate oxidase [Bacteroidia bacterium]
MDNLREYINKLRHDFSKLTLDESMINANPFLQFETWFKAAVDAQVNEPNAMSLATVNASGRPSSRILLLRNFDENGFVFYTNYNSRKGMEIAANPQAALLFFWPELERQVRIEGTLRVQTATDSDSYFASRPRSSRLGAWTSPQSSKISSRMVLDTELAAIQKRFENEDVPRPEWWGGYVLEPDYFEFWQGRESRLHDRICYEKNAAGQWSVSRLAP